MANAVTSLPENGSIPYEVFWKPLLNDPKINALPFSLHSGKIGREMYFDAEFSGAPTLKTTCGVNKYDYTKAEAFNDRRNPNEYLTTD